MIVDISSKLLQITDRNFGELAGSERAVLILMKSDCGHCTAYQAEIEGLLERGQMEEIIVGKMVLNERGVIRNFKRENPWLTGIKFLPHTLLYSKGQRVDGFAASKGSYLLERIESAFEDGLDLNMLRDVPSPPARISYFGNVLRGRLLSTFH
jgi:hypothetical protein